MARPYNGMNMWRANMSQYRHSSFLFSSFSNVNCFCCDSSSIATSKLSFFTVNLFSVFLDSSDSLMDDGRITEHLVPLRFPVDCLDWFGLLNPSYESLLSRIPDIFGLVARFSFCLFVLISTSVADKPLFYSESFFEFLMRYSIKARASALMGFVMLRYSFLRCTMTGRQ